GSGQGLSPGQRGSPRGTVRKSPATPGFFMAVFRCWRPVAWSVRACVGVTPFGCLHRYHPSFGDQVERCGFLVPRTVYPDGAAGGLVRAIAAEEIDDRRAKAPAGRMDREAPCELERIVACAMPGPLAVLFSAGRASVCLAIHVRVSPG